MDKRIKTTSRATTLEELETLLDKLFTLESYQRGLAFEPQQNDIIISPYAKCGTTWLQQIAHGLRTRGSMDFDEITTVTPWIEIAYDMKWDLAAPQVSEPHLYKSHLSWYDIPKGGRCICSFRHPADAFISYYRFFEGWFFEPGTIDLETLFHWRIPRDKVNEQGYWVHLTSWWEQRHNQNVLLLCFEDMKADLPATVQKIARFMGIELDDSLLDIVVCQSSRDFMLAHKHQFNDGPLQRRAEKEVGLPLNSDSHKVTAGTSGEARYMLPPTLRKELDDIWQEQIQPKFGFKDYGQLRQALQELH